MSCVYVHFDIMYRLFFNFKYKFKTSKPKYLFV